MPLILISQIQAVLKPESNMMNHYLRIPRNIFSESYLIPDNANISAYLKNVGVGESYEYETAYDIDNDFTTIVDEFEDSELHFIFGKSNIGLNDALYFRTSTWDRSRDFGIMAGFHFIRIRFEEVSYDDTTQYIS